MNIPKRQGNIPPEDANDFQSLDAVEIMRALKPRTGIAASELDASSSSIAPVGLELMPDRVPMQDRLARDDEAVPTTTGMHRLRRRRRASLIVGVLGGCALLVVAAGMGRAGHASSASSAAATPAPELPVPTPGPVTAELAPIPAAPVVEAAPAPASPDGSSVGTVRLAKGLRRNRILFDGKKIASTSALVSCGTHQIKIGHGRAHSVDVPCGGEVVVSK